MKKLLRSNGIINAFYEVLSSPTGDENFNRSRSEVIEINVKNPFEGLGQNLAGHRIAGI